MGSDLLNYQVPRAPAQRNLGPASHHVAAVGSVCRSFWKWIQEFGGNMWCINNTECYRRLKLFKYTSKHQQGLHTHVGQCLLILFFLNLSPCRRGTRTDTHTHTHTHTHWCDTVWQFIISAGYLKFAVRRIFRLKFDAVNSCRRKMHNEEQNNFNIL
jgi:hypothetical protein